MAEEEAEIEDQESDMDEGPESSRTLVDIPVIPFEPPSTGDGHDTAAKLSMVKTAIQSKVTPEEIGKLRVSLKGRLVSVTLAFFLWKGSSRTTNTRAVKDLDDLMKILFDVLGKSPQGLGLLEEDSYICEVYAKKELVDDESEEGLRIIIEEYQDEPMLAALTHLYTKRPKAVTN